MATFTEHQPYTFGKFISAHKFLKIPDYQRAYAWKIKETNEFFSAITDVDACFIGIIVAAVPADKQKRLEIVDGQQRLTTLSLSLASLRDLLRTSFVTNTEREKLIRKIDAQLDQFDPEENEHLNVLEPGREELIEIYRTILVGGEFPSGKNLDKLQQNYINNYSALSKLVLNYVGANLDKANELYNKIVNLQFIALVLSSDEDLQEIYDGLNSTGLGLSVAEQVKNKLLQRAKTLGIKADIDSMWDELETIFAKLEPSLFPKYLRHFWIANEEYISKKDLYSEIRKQISALNSEQLTAWVSKLLNSAQMYALMYSSRSEEFVSMDAFDGLPKKTVELFISFRSVNNVQVYPILLALADRVRTELKYLEKYQVALLSALWNFCLRSSLVSVSPADYEKILAHLAITVRTADIQNIQNEINEDVKKLSKLVSQEDQFVQNFTQSLSYNTDSKLIVAVLEKIIASYDPTIKLTEQNIEHILPQKPAKWGLKKKDIREFVHNIGNLTLLHPLDNNRAGNESFSVKCESVFKTSKLTVNNLIPGYNDFITSPKDAISKRALDLAHISQKVFKVSLSK